MVNITWMEKPVDKIGNRFTPETIQIHLIGDPEDTWTIVSIDDVKLEES